MTSSALPASLEAAIISENISRESDSFGRMFALATRLRVTHQIVQVAKSHQHRLIVSPKYLVESEIEF